MLHGALITEEREDENEEIIDKDHKEREDILE